MPGENVSAATNVLVESAMRRFGAIVGALAVLPALAIASDRDFSLEAESLFMGTEVPPRVQPFVITAENRGPDTRGVITVTAGEFSMRYPIDLPQGSRKRLIAYLTAGYYLQGLVTLDTPRGGGQFRLEASVANSGPCVAAVSDAPGELGFLRTGNGNRGISVVDLYLKPELMPERAAGYAGASAVYLSDGSERMNDEAFGALKRYMLAGGTVIVTGGASMPLHNDPRWQPLLPIQNARPRTVNLNGSSLGLTTSGAATLGVGNVAPGAKVLKSIQGLPFAVEQRHGLGRLLYIALNLTEGPAKGWGGRDKLFAGLEISTGPGEFGQLLDATVLLSRNDYGYSTYAAPAPVPARSSPPGSYYPAAIQERDPFRAKVPDTTTVVGILLLYLVIVVPVNLLILRKIGKGEMAWITSPIISLAFAAVFFRFSAALYAADLSVATSGVVIGHQGDSGGYFLGKSQMFFPRGGRYDLKLRGVEAIFGSDPTGGMRQGSGLEQLAAVDTGEIVAPEASVTNLSFREFSLLQRVDVTNWFDVRVQYAGGKPIKATVTNRSPYSLFEGGILLQGRSYALDSLAPGQTKTTGAAAYRALDPMVDIANRSGVRGGNGSLVGILDGFRGGPQIGTVAASSNRTWLLYTFSQGARP